MLELPCTENDFSPAISKFFGKLGVKGGYIG